MNSISDAQLAKILSAISALHTDGWWQWFPVVSVFVSALLAMLVGIALQAYKNSRTTKKMLHDKLEKEISEINVAISGIIYNIERLLHVVSDFILPHHDQIHKLFTALHKAQGDPQKLQSVAASLSAPNYPALRTTCPELHFIEWDFFKALPFLVSES